MTARVVTLGDGRRIPLGAYVAAWKAALSAPADSRFRGSPSDPRGWRGAYSRADLLEEFRAGLADRINRKSPGFGNDRKWSRGWFMAAWRLSRDVNTPRLVVRLHGNPAAREFVGKLAHRLETDLSY